MFPALFPVPTAQAGDLRAYQGGHFRVLAAPTQSQHACALLDLTLPRGAEPQRQVHTQEDQTFYVLEGEVTFQIGDDTLAARVGQSVFVPRRVPYRFTIGTPQVRLLVLLTPGRLLGHFMAYSGSLSAVRPVQGPPPFEVMLAMVHSLRSQYGVLTC